VIDAVHERHPCQEAEDEADDGCSFVHHFRNPFRFSWFNIGVVLRACFRIA
jgi:hypothetical protein